MPLPLTPYHECTKHALSLGFRFALCLRNSDERMAGRVGKIGARHRTIALIVEAGRALIVDTGGVPLERWSRA